MAGLENYLSALKDNAGMAGGFNQGMRDRTTQDSALAALAQRQAETQRYTGETPSYLQKSQAGARTAELANVQGEADLAAGVPGAKAQESLATSRQKALEAQQVWERLPQEHKTKMLSAMKNKTMEMFDVVEQTLAQTSDVPATIALIEQQYPEITKDQSWGMAKQQVSRMPPQQAMNEIRKMKASMASSDAYGDPKFQGDMIKEDQQQAGRMALADKQGQYGLAAAQARAAAGGPDKPTMATIYNKYLTQYTESPAGSPEKEEARVILNMLKSGGTTTEDSGIPGLPPVTKSKEALPKDADKAASQGSCRPGYTMDSRGVCVKSK